MKLFSKPSTAILGSLSAIIAVFCFSTNDVAIKFISKDYALHLVVLIRSLVGLIVLFLFIVPLSGGVKVLYTNRLGLHLLRGFCVVFANITFFLGLAALPLAEGVAIFFISPLLITIFSVVFLKELVGPRRWAAVTIGLIGVLVILRPGSETFQTVSLLPLSAALGYATLHMLTRYIGKTESAASMSLYIQLTFLAVCLILGLIIGDGKFAGWNDPSLEFLFRAWSWPSSDHYSILILIGTTSAFGGFFISQAYRISEAAVVAPFEYIALPIAIFWGVIVFGEFPDKTTFIGIVLILGSGLYIIWRETILKDAETPKTPRYRR
jgi:drug/metabolite transporter (DMT)-like permease